MLLGKKHRVRVGVPKGVLNSFHPSFRLQLHTEFNASISTNWAESVCEN